MAENRSVGAVRYIADVGVAVSGRIGSGKTTFAKALAGFLAWPIVSFGDYVRSVALARGLSQERQTLQDLGAALIEEKGWHKFCADTLSTSQWRPGTPLVVDGIRHAEVIPVLAQLIFPLELVHVHINAAEDLAYKRVAARTDSRKCITSASTMHSTEVQVTHQLLDKADLVLNAEKPVKVLVAETERWLFARQSSE